MPALGFVFQSLAMGIDRLYPIPDYLRLPAHILPTIVQLLPPHAPTDGHAKRN